MKRKLMYLVAMLLTAVAGTTAWGFDPIALTPNADGTEWTLGKMPDRNVRLRVVYYTDQDYANDVTNLIAAIGAFEPTAAHKEKIEAAREAYDALTEGQQALVSNYDVLEAAEAAYNAYFHTVSLADGTEDASNWKAKAGEGDYQAFPVSNVGYGASVYVQYGGEKVVKSVKAVKPNPLAVPLTVEALTAGTINVANPKAGMQYSLNGGDKTAVTADPINVAAGDKVAFYGNGTSIAQYGDSSVYSCTWITGDAQVKVYGNIMSLVDETGFATNKSLTANYTFASLFYLNTKLTDASGLLLPAETLTESCYAYMFRDCGALTTAPELPATTLAESCYRRMFHGCESLAAAPELKATTLANGCYQEMFKNCGSLNSVTCLATDINASDCTRDWLAGVAASGTFTKASGVDWSGKGIPTWNGWTVEEAAAAEPEPAPADIELTPTENANEWTFTMPAEDVELQVAYYTEDELAAMAVDALITAIGEVAYTADSKALIDAAREAYDELTGDQQALVANYAALETAEVNYAIAAIADIGEVAYTAESKALIDAAREAYDELTGDQQALVANYAVLETAETAYVAAEEAAYTDGVELTDNGDGTWTLDATPPFDVELEVTYYTDDEVAALDVDALIDAIGEVAFTPESEALIDAARKAYDALTPDQKALVAKYETLTAAETTYFEAKMLDAGFVVKDGVLIEYIGEGGDVVIPDGVMAIGQGAFSTNIVTSVTMPNSVTNIYDTAFSACVNLSNVTFGAGVDIIGNWAFSGCRKLMSLTFKGDAPTTVALSAFNNVPWDAVVYVQPDAEGWDPVPGLWQDRAMVYEGEEVPEFIVNDGVLLLYTGEGGDVAVPDGVTAIYDYAFWRKGISSVEIPAGVTNLGESAFSDCHDLTNVTVGADVANIAYGAFYNCTNLASVTFLGDAPALGQYVFSGVPTTCVVYVQVDSKGWGVEIPGTWNDMEIRYSTVDVAVDAGTGEQPIDITVIPGEVYTDNVISQITEIAQASATRHGQVVAGWKNFDGSEVTGATVVGLNDSLTAQWESVNALVPETKGEGPVPSDKASTYDCYILDAAGDTYGTATVSVGKRNKSTGLATVKAVVKILGSNKSYTFKATEAKGKATISDTEMTVGVELAHKKLGTMTLNLGEAGVRGTWGAYEINGAINASRAAKALYAEWAGVKTVAVADASGAYSTFSFKIGKNGSVSVKGCMADGAAMSCTTRLMVADDGSEACVAIKGTARVPVGFTLWLGVDGEGNVIAEGIESETDGALEGAAFAGEAGVAATSYTFSAEDITVGVDCNGKTFKAPQGSGVTLRYTKSTGVFSGSFKVAAADSKGRVRNRTVSFKGVFVDGVGYGTTTKKGSAGIPVTIVAE